MKINEKISHLGDRMQREFKAIFPHIKGHGIDVGCGTNRLSPDVLSVDQQGDKRYAHADVVHNCVDLEVEKPVTFKGEEYSFNDNEFDFIFSSHCLEDFDNISQVFSNWWKKLKPNGLMILLLPDMEPCDCKFCSEDSAIAQRKEQLRSARYWTIQDYEKYRKGNPSHRTNVGKKFVTEMLNSLPIKYEMIQSDTINHNQSCTIDFVIKKIQE